VVWHSDGFDEIERYAWIHCKPIKQYRTDMDGSGSRSRKIKLTSAMILASRCAKRMVKRLLAVKRRIQPGWIKLAGRTWYKGSLFSKYRPGWRYAYTQRWRSVDNRNWDPLGVPSRDEIGQILESSISVGPRKVSFTRLKKCLQQQRSIAWTERVLWARSITPAVKKRKIWFFELMMKSLMGLEISSRCA